MLCYSIIYIFSSFPYALLPFAAQKCFNVWHFVSSLFSLYHSPYMELTNFWHHRSFSPSVFSFSSQNNNYLFLEDLLLPPPPPTFYLRFTVCSIPNLCVQTTYRAHIPPFFVPFPPFFFLLFFVSSSLSVRVCEVLNEEVAPTAVIGI